MDQDLCRSEVLRKRSTPAVLVTVLLALLTGQVVLPHPDLGAGHGVSEERQISVLQVVRGGQSSDTVSSGEDVPGPHQGPPALELEVRRPTHTVPDIDQPGVLAQLSLLPVHDPPLGEESQSEQASRYSH